MRLLGNGSACLYLLLAFFFLCAPLSAFAAEASVETQVRAYFEDTPVMIDIAFCESKFRQFYSDGLPLRGGLGGAMIGVFQVYERVHSDAARHLGLDLATLEGNMAYAKHLYSTSGTAPWNSARTCWETAPAQAPTELSDEEVTQLQEQVDALVRLVATLQELLQERTVASA